MEKENTERASPPGELGAKLLCPAKLALARAIQPRSSTAIPVYRHGVVNPWETRTLYLAETDSGTAGSERASLMSGSRYFGLAPSTDAPCSEADSKTSKRPRLAPPVRHPVRNGPPQPARLRNVCSIRGCHKPASIMGSSFKLSRPGSCSSYGDLLSMPDTTKPLLLLVQELPVTCHLCACWLHTVDTACVALRYSDNGSSCIVTRCTASLRPCLPTGTCSSHRLTAASASHLQERCGAVKNGVRTR